MAVAALQNDAHFMDWRAVHPSPEDAVWEIIEHHRINHHPAYWLGFGRTSCMSCIFGSCNQWATIRQYAPEHFERIAQYEAELGVTIQRKRNVHELADAGTPYLVEDPRHI